MGGVAVVSKDQLLLDGLALILEQDGPFQVVSRSRDLGNAVAAAAKASGHAILIESAGLSDEDKRLLPGIRAMGLVKLVMLDVGKASPDADVSIPRSTDKAAVIKALRDLLGTVRRSGVRESRAIYGSRLTPREYDVARLVAQGFSNRRISVSLKLQEQSVKNLVSVIMRKLHCENRVQVALHLTGYTPETEHDA